MKQLTGFFSIEDDNKNDRAFTENDESCSLVLALFVFVNSFGTLYLMSRWAF